MLETVLFYILAALVLGLGLVVITNQNSAAWTLHVNRVDGWLRAVYPVCCAVSVGCILGVRNLAGQSHLLFPCRCKLGVKFASVAAQQLQGFDLCVFGLPNLGQADTVCLPRRNSLHQGLGGRKFHPPDLELFGHLRSSAFMRA